MRGVNAVFDVEIIVVPDVGIPAEGNFVKGCFGQICKALCGGGLLDFFNAVCIGHGKRADRTVGKEDRVGVN